MEGSLEGILEITNPLADMQECMHKIYKKSTPILNFLAPNFLTLQRSVWLY